MQLAQLSKKNFEAERGGAQLVEDATMIANAGSLQHSAAMVNIFLGDGKSRAQYLPLTIPRRPAWDKSMTAHEIEQQENMAFLEWRRDIATMEQDNIALAITPFEKNVDIWRQLWRVIEKCDLLLQIVDARNPYFFYSADLEKYIKEVGEGKQFILLVNKADYLSPELIAHWNAYFSSKGINHIFFSALKEQTRLDAGELDALTDSEDEDDEDEDEADDAAAELEELKQREETLGGFKNELERQAREEDEANRKKSKLNETLDEEVTLELNTQEVFSRAQLLTWLKRRARVEERDDRMVVGTVGYPNVGKSSVINVLMGVKKVGVAALPGKTKHF